MTSWAHGTLLYVLCTALFLILWIGVLPYNLILIATSVELSPHKVRFQRTDVLDSTLGKPGSTWAGLD